MNLKFWVLRRLFKYLSPIISIFEKNKIKKYSQLNTNHEPIFIIGPPRSGSTILYQLLTNSLDVIYIDNLIHMARENLYFGFWLSHLLYNNKPHNNFKSSYGNTQAFGLHAPSEGGNIWYRWFSKDKVYFEKDDLSDKQISEIRNTFHAITNRFQRPIVIKNLMFSQRISVIAKIFPTAKFIFIKRIPEFNAQSIYKARLKEDKNTWWSAKPRNYKEILTLPLINQSVKQVYYLEKQISEDLKLFPQKNIKKIRYEELIEKPETVLIDLQNFIDAKTRIENFDVKLKSGNKIKINDKDFRSITELTNDLNWETYKNN